jgi:PKD repeat protein
MIRTLLFFSLILCLGGFQAQAQAVADFSATPRTLCIQPYEVSFFNLSQGDTALLWDFGDGNTSSFSQPNHVYQNPGTYTVTLIAYGPGGNDTLVQPGFVVINASPADPVVSPAADTVACGSSARFVASGQPDLLWTDSNGTLVARGDTLDIPLASQSRTFFVRSEQEGAPTRVGPFDPDSVGGGGFFNGDQGLVFDVFSDLRIKSALVNAGAAGVRTFTLTDTFGIVLETLDVFIPAGRSRVPLDLELIPGSYVIRGNGVNLFRNNAGNPAYPFEAPGLISIRTSTVGNDFYYFFYDWEVVTFCRSNEVQVDLTVDPLSGPSLASDTVTADCGNSAELIASAANEVAWYDLADNFLAQGDTFRLPFAGGNSLFFVRNTSNSNSLSVGAADPDSLGSAGGYQQGGPAIWLNFEVFSDMTLQSVWVDADSAGDRNIQVRDGAGGLVALQVVSLPAGRSRVNLDLDLTPGEYLIGGANLGLFRNDSTNVAYPYSLPGIVSITGSSTGEQTYNFFYDWEVGVTCLSDRDSMVLQVNPPLAPSVSPDSVTVTCSGSAQFVASGLNQIVWTDNTDAILQRGDTLNLQGITSSGTFFAQDVAESNPEFVGPLNGDTTGTGGYYNFNFFAYQEFEVYADIRIESAWVDANTPGQRTVEIRDLGNNLLQSVSVNIPAGQGRVNLGIELTPGTYRIGGLNMDLFRNTNGPDYPYVLPGALAITGSSAQASQNFYYFFYDWEVVRLCKSPKVPVEVILTPPPTPVISPASVSADCGDNVQLVATAINDVSWYDQNNLLLQQGDTLNLTGVTGTASYFARSVAEGTPAQVGPVDGTSVGGGGYHNFNIFSYLEFEVYSSLRLQSVWVDANTGGNRTIELRDGLGNPLQSIQVNIPAGQSRVTLNLELEPGSYQIGGFNMDLFRNNNGPAYPYEQPGLISIMGSSAGPGFYYYLYDWEVVPLCQGPLAQVDVTVGALAAPVLDSSQVTVPCNGSTTVIASGNGVTKWYDANGLLIASGDTLQTPPVINNTTLFAQQESPSTSVFGQPQDNAIGGGGFFASDARWLIFDVNQPGLLRSVKVYAENPGNRTIEYRDATGNVLESTTVFIPTGESRVALNFELVPGSDQQLADQRYRRPLPQQYRHQLSLYSGSVCDYRQ